MPASVAPWWPTRSGPRRASGTLRARSRVSARGRRRRTIEPREGADGLGDGLLHHHDDFRKTFGVDEWHGTNVCHPATAITYSERYIPFQQPRATSRWETPGTTSTSHAGAGEWSNSPEGYPQTPSVTSGIWHDETRQDRWDRPAGALRAARATRRAATPSRPSEVRWAASKHSDFRAGFTIQP